MTFPGFQTFQERGREGEVQRVRNGRVRWADAMPREGIPTTGSTIFYGLPYTPLTSAPAGWGLATGSVWYSPLRIEAPIWLTTVACYVQSVTPTKNIHFALYCADENLQPTGPPLHDIALAITGTGIFSASLDHIVPPGVYLQAVTMDGTVTFTAWQGGEIFAPTTLSTGLVGSLKGSFTYGAFTEPGPAWTANEANNGGIVYCAIYKWVQVPN